MTTYFPFLVLILLAFVFFLSGLKNGVVKLLASGIASLTAMIGLFVLLNVGPKISEGMMGGSLSWQVLLAITLVISGLLYIIALLIALPIVKMIFNPDSFLHGLVDGIPGGILALFPWTVLAIFVMVCFRIAGTAQELHYVNIASQPGSVEARVTMDSEWPLAAKWRDVMEGIPGLAAAFDFMEPFSRRENRNLAALTLMARSPHSKELAQKDRYAGPLIGLPQIDGLLNDEEVAKMIEKSDRVGLVLAPTLREAASSTLMKSDLKKIDVPDLAQKIASSLKPISTEEILKEGL